MTTVPATIPPKTDGYYLCYGYGCRPVVLWANKGQMQWRDCARIIPITHYAGPLPERIAE